MQKENIIKNTDKKVRRFQSQKYILFSNNNATKKNFNDFFAIRKKMYTQKIIIEHVFIDIFKKF